MEKFAPSYVGKGGFASAMRATGAISAIGGFLYFYQRSIREFPAAGFYPVSRAWNAVRDIEPN